MLAIEERIRLEEGLDTHRQEVGDSVENRLQGGQREIFESRWREVAECLLARNTSLYMAMTMSPTLWTGTTAPLILRPMIEVAINIAYIAKEPVERSKTYIEHGLGTAKALAEKYDTASLQNEDQDWKDLFGKAVEEWKKFIECEKELWAVNVNMGDWDKSSTRQRALEIGLKDLYGHAWAAFSGCVHSTWQHVGRYNGTRCVNPLHRGHIRGRISGWADEWSFDYLFRAAKYLDMTLNVYDEALSVRDEHKSVRELCINWAEREKRRMREREE